MYAICRAVKLGSAGEVGGSSLHTTRGRETPNADPTRSHLNQVIFGAADPGIEIERRISELKSQGVKIRKNGVRAIELMLGASPEFFSKHPERKEDFYRQSVDWLKSYFGGEKNVVSVIAHEDELTPHLAVYVLPLDDSARKKGQALRLNAARWLDGKTKMSRMQTSFADAVKNLGLERGIEGSKAKHQDVQRWYGILQRVKALTGIEDDLQAAQTALANKQRELEHLRVKERELDRIIMELGQSRKDRKVRIEQARKIIQEKFQECIIKDGEKISGILTPNNIENKGKMYSTVSDGQRERYVPYDQAQDAFAGELMTFTRSSNAMHMNKSTPKMVRDHLAGPGR